MQLSIGSCRVTYVRVRLSVQSRPIFVPSLSSTSSSSLEMKFRCCGRKPTALTQGVHTYVGRQRQSPVEAAAAAAAAAAQRKILVGSKMTFLI